MTPTEPIHPTEPVRHYRQLKVWRLGMEIAEGVYRLTADFPKHELYGLSSQIRRAAVSIPSNIAEGHSRESTKEYLHHISFALGSLAELETQLLLSSRLQYSNEQQIKGVLEQADGMGKMLHSLRIALREKLESLAPRL
jgi:four helix bundle protein